MLAPYVRDTLSLRARLARLEGAFKDFTVSTPRRDAIYQQYRRLRDVESARARSWNFV